MAEGALRMDLDGCFSIEVPGDEEGIGCVMAGATDERTGRAVEPILRVFSVVLLCSALFEAGDKQRE